MIILLIFLASFATLALFTRLVFQQLAPAAATQPTKAATYNLLASEEDPPNFPPLIDYRAEFTSGPGTTVFGWPSKGGIYVFSPCFGVELNFMELDRFSRKERSSTSDADSLSDEEAHCNRKITVRRLGATWWRSRNEYTLSQLNFPNLADIFIRVGWPVGGGVWILKTTFGEANENGAAMIQNAYGMEERCRVIEQIGGVFYANAKDCPYLDLA